jgi:hypothetical protein
MGKKVEWNDIDLSQSKTATVTTTSTELTPSRLGLSRRTQLIVTNTSPTTLTLYKGASAAVAGRGILLSQNQTYIESDDSGFKCWQGAIWAVASASSTVTMVETTEK